MTITMYDAIDVSQVPPNPQAVAGYVGGFWPDYSQMVKRFPNAHHLSIAVNASEDADCLDIENGDAVPSEAPAWVLKQVARGVVRPVVYADASTMPAVLLALSKAGIKRSAFRVWVAHFTFVPHIEAGADATQWTDKALNRNLDCSECVDDFFSVPPPPPPVVNPPHYDWFAKGPFGSKWGDLNEQLVVEQYDGARSKPIRYALYLKFILRPKLQFLADRVADIAIKQQPNADGKPSWDKFHRGWRYQQLIHRAQGTQFVK